MPKRGHTEEQIVAALTAQEGGETTKEICRRMGISTATFYSWRKQYAGVGVSELRELRQLREENNKLKAAGGGSGSGQAHSPGGGRQKAVGPRRQREVATWVREAYRISERRAGG